MTRGVKMNARTARVIINARLSGLQYKDILEKYNFHASAIRNAITNFATPDEIEKIKKVTRAHVLARWQNQVNPRRLFSQNEADEIRNEYSAGTKIADIAQRHECARFVVWRIVKGLTYKEKIK